MFLAPKPRFYYNYWQRLLSFYKCYRECWYCTETCRV